MHLALKQRCKEWVESAGNHKLYSRPIKKLHRSAFPCQQHFASNQYISFHPRRLIHGALPSIFPSDDSNSNLPSSSAGMSSSCSTSTSLNESKIEGKSQCSLKSYITKDSLHTGFWASALKEIQVWMFIKDEVIGCPMRPKS